MKLKMQYLYMEMKKTLRILPGMILQAVLLMAITGVIAFGAARVMGKEPLTAGVDIAVVVREDNMMTQMALGYVESMESVSKFCHFLQVSEKEGISLLNRGEVAALVLLPEKLVEGIMSGVNPEVKIYFRKDAGLEAMLFQELTGSAEGMLRVAQAQIYGAYDMAVAYGLTEQLSGMEAEIDSYNLAFALDRLALYDMGSVSAFGRMNAVQFYVASGFVMFLLLAGMAMYPVMQKEPLPFCRQLERQGVGMVWQCFGQWLCSFLCMSLIAGAVYALVRTAVKLMPDDLSRKLVTGGAGGYSAGIVTGRITLTVLIVVMVTTFIYLLYSVADSRTGGVLLVFLLSVVMVYLSGGLVPSLFLPEIMQAVGDKLPTACLFRAAGALLTGYVTTAVKECVVYLCGYTIVFGMAACLLRCKIV